MDNLIADISTLSTIDKKTLTRLSDIAAYCICSDVEESVLSSQDITEIDIEVGKLLIKHTSDEVHYKFIPSAKLERSIVSTITNKKSPLEPVLEKSLVNKLTNTYKDLI